MTAIFVLYVTHQIKMYSYYEKLNNIINNLPRQNRMCYLLWDYDKNVLNCSSSICCCDAKQWVSASYHSFNQSNCHISNICWPWWRHQMEAFSALLAICAGNSPVTGEFPAQRPVTRSFDVFFDLRLNKRLSKQSWGWWLETPSRLLGRHCNGLGSYSIQGLSITDSPPPPPPPPPLVQISRRIQMYNTYSYNICNRLYIPSCIRKIAPQTGMKLTEL